MKGALDYFEKENPHSIELNNVRDLHELGGDALSREFGELIKKVTRFTDNSNQCLSDFLNCLCFSQHSRPVPAVDILNAISEDGGSAGTPDPDRRTGGGRGTKVARSERQAGAIEVAGHLGDSASIQHFPGEKSL